MAEKPITNLLSAFFVNEYLNKFKTQAAEKVAKNICDSTFDAYRVILVNFTNIFCGEGHKYGIIYYDTVMENFYKTLYTQFYADDQYLNFIDRTILEFLSKDFYNTIKSFEKKDEILRNILRESIKEFTAEVLKEHVQQILTPPNDKQSIVVLLKKRMTAVIISHQNLFIMSHNLPQSQKDSATIILELKRQNLYLEDKIKALEGEKVALRALLEQKISEKNAIARERNQYLRQIRSLFAAQKKYLEGQIENMNATPISPLVRPISPPNQPLPKKIPHIFEVDD